jgi:hypothetical protein
MLVDVSRFDVATIEGQRKLANEIMSQGASHLPPAVIVLGALLIALMLFMFIGMVKDQFGSPIPHTLVAVRYYYTEP